MSEHSETRDRSPEAAPPSSADAAAGAPADPPADPGGTGVPGGPGGPCTTSAEPSVGGGGRRRWFRRARTAPATQHRKAPWWELPALVALAIGIAILVKSFVVQPFYIPSDSMEQTLHGCTGCHGDRILVNKLIFDFRDPHPGDIVVFHAPPGWNDEPPVRPPGNPVLRVIRGFGQLIGFVPPDGQILVKRVIAVGGQTVKGDAAGHVFISANGPRGPYRQLDEPYVYAPPLQRVNEVPFGPVTVPKGRLWVMGDHRTDSADSRFHCVPGGPESTSSDRNCNPISSTVPVGNVIGKAFVIAWPPSRWRTLGTPTTFTAQALGAGEYLPGAASVAVVAPILLVRRRRRTRLRRAVPSAPGGTDPPPARR